MNRPRLIRALRIAWTLPPLLWVRLGVIPFALFILAMFLLGLPPLAGVLDYTREIPLSEVIDYARTQGIAETFDSVEVVYMAMFVPIAVVGLMAFLCLQGKWALRFVVVANIVLPALWLFFLLPIFVVVGPPLLLNALAGQSDGETWSEGFICFAAIGSWTTLWLAVAILIRILGWQQVRESTISFSLRTLLIATTLIAVLLGLVVWAMR